MLSLTRKGFLSQDGVCMISLASSRVVKRKEGHHTFPGQPVLRCASSSWELAGLELVVLPGHGE